MKSRLIVISLLVIVFTVFTPGCEEDHGISVQEVLDKSIEAIKEANSSVFEIETDQEINMPGFDSIAMRTFAAGKSIEDPMAAEIDMQIEMDEMQMDMTIYLVDDILYMSIPGLGWVKEDITEDRELAQAFEDPFEYFDMLKEADLDNFVMQKEGDYYLLTYEDETGELVELMKEQIREEMAYMFFNDPDMDEFFGEVDFSDLYYSVRINSNTFLPAENRIAFTMTMEMMEEKIYIEQDTTIKYLEFGTFDTITVPDEVLDQAVPIEG